MDCGEREKGEGCEKDKETVKEKEKERDLEVGIRRQNRKTKFRKVIKFY